jgi:hypothetical protein
MAGLILYTISFAAAMVSIPASIYFFIRSIPGLIQRGPTTWFLGPLQMMMIREYRPEYQTHARRLQLSLVVTMIAGAILWNTR